MFSPAGPTLRGSRGSRSVPSRRARFAADRFRYGGIVGGHVAVWAALHPDRPLPHMVDDIVSSKANGMAAIMRRRIAAERAVTRNDAEAVRDVDVEAAEGLVYAAAAATTAAKEEYLRGGGNRLAGAQEAAAEEDRRRLRTQAALDAQAAALRDAGIRAEDHDPSVMGDALAAAGIAGVTIGKDGKIKPHDIIRIAEAGERSFPFPSPSPFSSPFIHRHVQTPVTFLF